MFSSAVISYSFLAIAIVSSTTLAYPAETKNQPIVKVITVDEVSKLKNLPPGAELVPLSQDRQPRGFIRYYLGEYNSSDILINHKQDTNSWDRVMDYVLAFDNPTVETGVLISFVQIDVNQSSNEGKAYVVKGGLGQEYIVIYLEAFNTLWCDVDYKIYAKKSRPTLAADE